MKQRGIGELHEGMNVGVAVGVAGDDVMAGE